MLILGYNKKMQPSEEDLKHWQEIAKRRNAIMPLQFKLLTKKDISVTCGKCNSSFMRPIIVGQNDPIYVCPSCQSRNYIPIDWNTIRGYGKRNY